jgi:hypothetical protein
MATLTNDNLLQTKLEIRDLQLAAACDENDKLMRLLGCYDELTTFVENLLATVDEYGVRISDLNELERLVKQVRQWRI